MGRVQRVQETDQELRISEVTGERPTRGRPHCLLQSLQVTVRAVQCAVLLLSSTQNVPASFSFFCLRLHSQLR